MCIITLKLALKAALPTGRIRQQSWRIHDPTPKTQMAAGSPWPDFAKYTRLLSPDEWTLFQHKERMFRKSLDTKRLEEKRSFIFSGKSPEKWIKIIRILCGLYFKNCVFSTCHNDGRPYGIHVLKYTQRILKKFPRLNQTIPDPRLPDSLRDAIATQLRFIRDVIQPQLTNRGAERQHPTQVGRNKLSYLWQQRRSKAIYIILNSSTYPSPTPTVSNVDLVQKYYANKCSEVDHAPLQDPPWQSQVTTGPVGDELHSQAFIEAEIEQVITSLPNNKASGSDGVTYETLKARMQVSCPTLTHIFNVCLLNGKICESIYTEPLFFK